MAQVLPFLIELAAIRVIARSGETDPVQFKGPFKHLSSLNALFAYKNGRFASSFLLLGIGFL